MDRGASSKCWPGCYYDTVILVIVAVQATEVRACSLSGDYFSTNPT